jgi:hypothetical protein
VLGRVPRWRNGALAVRSTTRESASMDKAVFRGGVSGAGYFASAPLVMLEFDEHEMKMSGPGAKGRIKKSEISNIQIHDGRLTAKLTVRRLDGTRAFRTFGLVGGGAALRRSLLERGWPVDP